VALAGAAGVVERKKVRETGRIQDLRPARTIESIDDLMKMIAGENGGTRTIGMIGVLSTSSLSGQN
jgi:hypothetical protein